MKRFEMIFASTIILAVMGSQVLVGQTNTLITDDIIVSNNACFCGRASIVGPHIGGSRYFLRYSDNSVGDIYGFEIQNWAGDAFASDRTQLSLTSSNPTNSEGVVSILSGTYGASYSAKEIRLGSYSYSGADVILYPGETKTLVAKANGNVGIGTILPSERLHVVGNAIIASNLNVNGIISGSGSGLSNVNASQLGGVAYSNFVQQGSTVSALRFIPQGDLSMGSFTNGPAQ